MRSVIMAEEAGMIASMESIASVRDGGLGSREDQWKNKVEKINSLSNWTFLFTFTIYIIPSSEFRSSSDLF